MDSNGLRSFGLTWGHGLFGWPAAGDGTPTVEAAPNHVVTGVRLANRASAGPLVEARSSADQVVLEPAMVIDAGGNTLRWDRANAQLVSISALADSHPELEPVVLTLPAGAMPVTDLALGADDVLYVAGGGTLWLIDLRGRFEPTAFAVTGPQTPSFSPQKLAVLPGGGVLALDGTQGRVARVSGLPMFTTGVQPTRDSDARFDRCDPGPQPLAATVFPARFDADERPIGIACSGAGGAVVLTLGTANGGARIRQLRSDGRFAAALALIGPCFPNTVAWLDDAQLALATQGSIVEQGRAPRDPGVFVYAFDAALRARLGQTQTSLPNDGLAPLPPIGDYYPLAGWTGGPFVNGKPGARLCYPRSDRRTGAGPVARVSLASRCSHGVVANVAADGVNAADPAAATQAAVGRIDTRVAETVWHRVHVEACVPTGAAMIVWLAANDADRPAFDTEDPTQRDGWHAHLIGDRRGLPTEAAAALLPDTPVGTWRADASEVPFGQSLLGCAAVPGRTGLFSALVQRAGRAVRGLRGSRLWVTVELFGDGRATPELVALRFVAGRVSYRDRYLPALYHETAFGPAADQPSRATGADFLERLIHLFEGPFTSIEDRIASAWMLTDPHACPEDALPWLASWIGLALEPGTPSSRARLMIANAPRLAQRHGTLPGLVLALDIATEGAVARGRIVVVENWRLRRTLATILGAALSDHDDPLTAGISQTGNSFVGDSLFLGDENAKTFLALFRDLQVDPKANSYQAQRQRDERESSVHALYDGLAHRATVLVHEQASDDELRLVQRLAQTAAPAHVKVSVITARHPFIVGVASLVGADSYLRAPVTGRPVEADRSQLGAIDTLQGLASLDAQSGAFDALRAPPSPPPTARITADRERVDVIEPFALDGSASTAAPGRQIDLYTWSHHPPV